MRKYSLPGIVVGILILASFTWTAFAQNLDPAQVDRVRAAAPAKATATAKSPRKMLVFTLCKGFPHSSIAIAAKAMELLGEKTGAYTTVVSNDPQVFKPESLNQFDAVCFDNTTGTLFDDPSLKTSLMDFVKGGKGVVGIHAATDCFYDWPEYGEMMCGYFDFHPWGSDITVWVKLDDPKSPINQAFKGACFQIKDEIYQFKAPYSRDKVHELLSIDTARTDMNRKGINRTDGDFAISWIRTFGQGRVFYCSLGHNEAVFENPAVLQHYLDGIQYALGDLAADATPSGPLSDSSPVAAMPPASELDVLGEKLAHFEYGQDRQITDSLNWYVQKALTDDAVRKDLTARFATLAARDDASPACRELACKNLRLFGDVSIVQVIAPLLEKKETANLARYALESLSGDAVDAAFVNALKNAKGEVAVGLINSLGQRRSAMAVDIIKPFVMGVDAEVANAAMIALGNIGDKKAAEILIEVIQFRNRMDESCRSAADEAAIRCLTQLNAAGMQSDALILARVLYADNNPSRVRAAGLSGLAVIAPPEVSLPLLKQAAQGTDSILRGTAFCALREMKGEAVSALLAELLPGASPDVQVAIASAMGYRKDPAAEKNLIEMAANPELSVRTAAFDALAEIGSKACIVTLAKSSKGGTPDAKAAKNALDRLTWKDANKDFMAAVLECAPQSTERVEIIAALGRRQAEDVALDLLTSATAPDEEESLAAWQALRLIAPQSALPKMIEVFGAMKDVSQERQDRAESAVATTIKKTRDTGIKLLSDDYAKAAGEGNIGRATADLRVLGRVGDDAGLSALVPALQKAETRPTAVAVLAKWTTATPIADLLKAAEEEKSPDLAATAVRGVIKLLALPSDRPTKDTVAFYGRALERCTTNEEKSELLRGLGEVPDDAASDVIKRCATVSGLEGDVAAALERVQIRKFEVKGMTPILRNEKITCDGVLSEWRPSSFTLQSENQKIVDRVRFAWSSKAFYIAVETNDKTFNGTDRPASIWRFDSVQLAIDPLNAKGKSYDSNTIELGFQQAKSGTGGFVQPFIVPASKTPEMLKNITMWIGYDKNGKNIYEIAIPWEVLAPFPAAKVDTPFGLNICLSDTEDSGENTYIEWTPGIRNMKETAPFRTVVLLDDIK